MSLVFPAVISGFRPMRDKSGRITLDTQREMLPEDWALIGLHHGKPVNVAIRESAFSDEDVLNIPDISVEFKSDKTPSQRLRNVLFVWYEQTGGEKKHGTFTSFYTKAIEKLIADIKEKLT